MPVPVRSTALPNTRIPAITRTRTHPRTWYPHVAMRAWLPTPIPLRPHPTGTARRYTLKTRRRWRDIDAYAHSDLRGSRRRVAHAGQRKANTCNKGQFAGDADHGSLSLKCGSCTWTAVKLGNASVSDRVDVIALAGSGSSRSICDGRASWGETATWFLFCVVARVCPRLSLDGQSRLTSFRRTPDDERGNLLQGGRAQRAHVIWPLSLLEIKRTIVLFCRP